MYKIVPAERQGRSRETATKNRCKPSENGLQRSFLAPPARLELTTFRLGGGPSILVRYGGIYRNYSVIQGSGIRTVRLLGGGPSILVRYGGMSLSILPHLSALVNSENCSRKLRGGLTSKTAPELDSRGRGRTPPEGSVSVPPTMLYHIMG